MQPDYHRDGFDGRLAADLMQSLPTAEWEIDMRAAALTAFLVLFPASAFSQEAPAPLIRSEDIVARYCIHANKIYSLGSTICPNPKDPPRTCVQADREYPAPYWRVVSDSRSVCS